jgi:hypothetical protein
MRGMNSTEYIVRDKATRVLTKDYDTKFVSETM